MQKCSATDIDVDLDNNLMGNLDLSDDVVRESGRGKRERVAY